MISALDLAISVSLANDARDLSAPAEVVITRQPLVKVVRSKTGRTVAAPKPAAQPVAAAPQSTEPATKPSHPSPNGKVPVLVLPATGSVFAKGFAAMMRNAKSRDEKICAIAAYCGWDPKKDFASQEMAALAKARSENCPIIVDGPSREERRQASNSVKGYVAGMPDNQRKHALDLLGRENLAVLTRNDHVRDARNHERSIADRKLSIGLARLEQERLAAIRADIAALG